MLAEEKLLSMFYCHPLEVVSIEGSVGLFIYVIALFVLQQIPCHPIYAGDGKSLIFCPYSLVEDSVRAIGDLCTNNILLIATFFVILDVSFVDFCGVTIVKYASAMHRAVISAGRPIILWIFTMSLGWEKFLWLQFIGYLVNVTGIMLYYEVIQALLNEEEKKEDRKELKEGE